MSRGAVLVTGAGKRVGAVIAAQLAQAGLAVLLHCHGSSDEADALASELRAGGAQAEVYVADLAEQTSIDAMCDALTARGDWVGLVNSAASFVRDDIDDFDLGKANAQWTLNLAAPIYLARRLKAARAGAPGFVINIADQKVLNPNPDYLSYTVSKLGLAAATPTLAMALAPNIRVNAIAPGLMLPSGDQTQEQFDRVHKETLLQRGARPEDVAAAVVFLASAENITGALLPVDAGQHLVPSLRDVMFN